MEDSLKQQLKDVGYNGKFDLSSLIEACGDDFQLTKWDLNSNWIASTEIYYDDAGYQDDIGKGKTPLIAVAKLYIKLNKK